MKTFIRDIIKWAAALAIAYLLANIALIPYYHYTPGIPLEFNGTSEIYYPGSVFYQASEGCSYGRFDANGYYNPAGSEDRDDYVLVMGSSHTMGKEVTNGKNYCRILEDKYHIPVYNMSMDGHLYTDVISGFSAAIRQFPDSSSIVIETAFTEYDIDDLKDALKQREYDEAMTGKVIAGNMKGFALLKSKIQTWFPYRILLKQRIRALKTDKDEPNTGTGEEYLKALNDTMQLMRKDYDKPIMILYHPSLSIDKSGAAHAAVDNEETLELFRSSCEQNNIKFIDMTDAFVSHYSENNVLPHGFMNTSMGTGHLNRTGHVLVAERLAEELESYFGNGR